MVLAAQHHARLCALVVALLHEAREGLWGQQGKGGYLEPLLLTGETKAHDKRKALSSLADGSCLLAVGTHSLLSVTSLLRLGLVVLDESQKFGVEQLEKLSGLMTANRPQGQQQPKPPHLLNMTATPIPRTLAAAVYGHMDVSRLDEMPPGRTPMVTKIVEDDTDVPYKDPATVRHMDAMWKDVLRELTTDEGQRGRTRCKGPPSWLAHKNKRRARTRERVPYQDEEGGK